MLNGLTNRVIGGLTSYGVPRGAAPFDPRSLFAAGEQGAIYDPSDFSTMFQDAAGTTPVTAVEQNVGLMLDKSKGLTLGPELVTNGTFDTDLSGWTNLSNNFVWSAGKAQLNSGAAGDLLQVGGVVGTWYICRFQISGAVSSGIYMSFVGNDVGYFSDGTYTMVLPCVDTAKKVRARVFAGKGGSIDNISVREIAGNHAYQTTSASRPLLSARYNLLVGTTTLSTQSVTTLATNYVLSFSGTGSVTLSGTATGTKTAGSNTITCTAGALTLTVTGSVTTALLVPADQASLPYQRVNTSTDYDTVGFKPYLKFDGVDDYLVTNSIDFTATDKMTVWAGMRKLSDAARGMACELGSGTGSGSFQVNAPTTSMNDFGYFVRGSTATTFTTTYTALAPITKVIAGISSISEDICKLRINGTEVASSAGDQGTGNYGNYQLYIGRRAGTSLPFNGQIYSLIIRGAQSTDAQIIATEKYCNSKTGAY